MIVGFTGTRDGLTEAQKRAFVDLLIPYHGHFEFHHGDCIGADDDAHALVTWDVLSEDPGSGDPSIVIHPPSDDKLRAWRTAHHEFGDRLLAPKPYLERNRDIVDACDMLIACPKEQRFDVTTSLGNWPRRGGTWSTLRYALFQGKPITIIWPDGSTTLA